MAQSVVKWSGVYSKKTDEVILTATIEKKWHLYSQYISPNAGPVATKITFTKNKKVKIKGKPLEENVHAFYDENFGAHLSVFDDKAIFRQKIRVKKNTDLKVVITYMVCDDTRCLPPTDETLTIKIEK
jgi:thiol:disulfide interchange protein DsbD